MARNTVREAVRILELSGLVRYEVNRGAVVISPTPEKVEALYTARERLETAAVSRPAAESARRDEEGLRRARRGGGLARRAGGSSSMDLAFHSAIVAMLRSSRLDEFYAELMGSCGST